MYTVQTHAHACWPVLPCKELLLESSWNPLWHVLQNKSLKLKTIPHPHAGYYQGLIDWRRGHVTVHLAKFKPCLKIVTVSTVSIGAKPAKVTKYSIYSINYNRIWILLGIQRYIRVTCLVCQPLVQQWTTGCALWMLVWGCHDGKS